MCPRLFWRHQAAKNLLTIMPFKLPANSYFVPPRQNLLCRQRQMQSSYSSVMVGLAAFTTTASSYDFQVLAQMMLNLYPVAAALDTLATSSL